MAACDLASAVGASWTIFVFAEMLTLTAKVLGRQSQTIDCNSLFNGD
jgi:hypothetical protein